MDAGWGIDAGSAEVFRAAVNAFFSRPKHGHPQLTDFVICPARKCWSMNPNQRFLVFLSCRPVEFKLISKTVIKSQEHSVTGKGVF